MTSSDLDLGVERLGSGPPILLVHGGAPPDLTWELQRPLAFDWTLLILTRRGASPDRPAERQDFEVDATDIVEVLEAEGGAHLVGFSYGGAGAALAAERRPDLLRSLTLIEPALFSLARDQPVVRDVESAVRRGLEGSDPDATRWFLDVAGFGGPRHTALREQAYELAAGLRWPGDAEPDLSVLRSANVPLLSVSGGHDDAMEELCKAVAAEGGGEHLRIEGSGHAVQRAPGFNDRLTAFLAAAEERSS